MQTFEAKIEGVSPLLQHAFVDGSAMETNDSTRTIEIERKTPRQQAEECSYKSSKIKGGFFLPGASIGRLLCEAGSYHKQTGSRKSLKWIVPAGCIVTDDELILLDPVKGRPIKSFEVDSRPVVIPATKGRIMRHRPRFDEWATKIAIEVDKTIISPTMVHQLLTEGGLRIGVGDFRPQKFGSFGRFHVVSWDKIKD